MNMQEVRSIAKTRSIDVAGLNKMEIIHKVQRQEGNFDCFATAYNGVCDQLGCAWRKDCFEASRE